MGWRMSGGLAAAALLLIVLLGMRAPAVGPSPVSPASSPTPFSGERALEHVRRLVEIGPRVAGSPGAARAREYITGQIEALGLRVVQQTFEAETPLGTVEMVNLRVPIPADANLDAPRVVLAGHY